MMDDKKVIEAALFMSPKPLTVAELSTLTADKDIARLRKLLEALTADYAKRDTSLEVGTLGDSYLLQVKSDYEDKVAHLASESQFSKSVTKTLALISFKQPTRQSLVIKYRNTKAYDHIHLLEEKGFITRERAGRTFILRTTRKFLEYFGSQKKEQQTLPETKNEKSAEEKAEQ